MLFLPSSNRSRASHRRQGTLAVLLASWAFLAPVALHAAPTPQETATAREMYFDGDAKMRAGDLAGAYRSYRAADGIMGVPTTALKLARVEVELGLLVEAHENLERAIRYESATPMPSAFLRAQEAARELRDQVRPRLGSLVIVTDAAENGTLTLDDRPVPDAARRLALLVNPGPHRVAIVREGSPPLETAITMMEGGVETVSFDRPLGTTRAAPPPAAPPIVEQTAPAATPAPAPAVVLAPTPASSSSSRSPWIIGGSVAGGLGLLVGASTGILALSRSAQLSVVCPTTVCTTSSSSAILREANTLGTISTIGFVTAGVGLAVVVGALVWKGPTSGVARTHPLVAAASGRVEF